MSIASHLGILPRPDHVSEGLVVGIPKLRLDLGVGSTLRDVSRELNELATKLIQFVLELALFVFEFSIQDVDDPLVHVPEVIKLHLFQFWVLHAQPQGSDDSLRNEILAKEPPPEAAFQ
jgi:hypothetical protein